MQSLGEDAWVQAGCASPTPRLGRARRQRQLSSKVHGRQLRYVAVAAGAFHTVLLRSDGVAVASGSYKTLGLIPRPPLGVRYVDVAANLEHTLLLHSDGNVTACGPDDSSERQQIPKPGVGLEYVAIAAGAHHSVLLRSDGAVVACGHNGDGRCAVPPPPDNTCYTFVSAGLRHTVVWRSDGVALAFGSSSLPAGHSRVRAGPCDIPHGAIEASCCDSYALPKFKQDQPNSALNQCAKSKAATNQRPHLSLAATGSDYPFDP